MRLPGKSFFSAPKQPDIQPLPPLPEREDPAIARRKRETEEAAKRRRGRDSTRLSDGLGDPNVDRPALTRLGG